MKKMAASKKKKKNRIALHRTVDDNQSQDLN